MTLHNLSLLKDHDLKASSATTGLIWLTCGGSESVLVFVSAVSLGRLFFMMRRNYHEKYQLVHHVVVISGGPFVEMRLLQRET